MASALEDCPVDYICVDVPRGPPSGIPRDPFAPGGGWGGEDGPDVDARPGDRFPYELPPPVRTPEIKAREEQDCINRRAEKRADLTVRFNAASAICAARVTDWKFAIGEIILSLPELWGGAVTELPSGS
jgi:hypothetical protein